MAIPTNPVPFNEDLGLELWYEALRAELGLVITIPNEADFGSIMRIMYEIRRRANDPALAPIVLHVPENCSYIVLRKKTEAELE